jgi:hypothetical protein
MGPVHDGLVRLLSARPQWVVEVLVHVQTPADLPLLDAAMVALDGLDIDQEIYREMLFGHLQEIEGMNTLIQTYDHCDTPDERWPDYELSESERKSYYYTRGHRRGELVGELVGRAKAVIELLRLRGLAVPADIEAAVLACQDDERLHTWLARALLVARPEDLLD